MTTTQVLVTVIVLIVIAALGYGIWFVTRRRALQHRFGPEYDRAVAEGDSRLAAERELRERERRHAELELRELDPEARQRYTTRWEEIQARFLDDPASSVHDADALVTELIAERGYPTGDYEQHLTNLSVEHANTLGHYRDAHDISLLSDRGEATTEQLRQAVVHYRTLFAELLGTDVATTTAVPTPTTSEVPVASTSEVPVDAGADVDDEDVAAGRIAAGDDADELRARRAGDVPGRHGADGVPAPRAADDDVPHDTRSRS